MTVPLLDLKAGFEPQRGEIMAAIHRVVESQYFVGGPEVKAFEEEIAAYLGVKHAIGCASGTDALLLPLMALDIGPGDEVITTPFTFFATVGAISRLGATPVFVDIDPGTFNMDLEALAGAITSKTKAIIPIHLFGQAVDLKALRALGEATGIPILEDAAQAIGAGDEGGKAGCVGDFGAFSFYPSKNLGGYGDGGLITTPRDDLAERLRSLRAHGNFPRKYYHRWVGANSRLDAIQAAVLRVKLKGLEAWTEGRRANAARYRRLMDAKGLEAAGVVVPVERPGARHIYNQFTLRVPKRDELRVHLKERGIGSEVYYPVPLHRQACFEDLGYGEGAFPESERAAREVLSIPIYPELGADAQAYVVDAIAAFYGIS